MSIHETGYNFHPNDRVWYFDPQISSFKEGTTYQVEIKIYKKLSSPIERKLTYLLALDNASMPIRVKENDLYISTSGGLVQPPSTPIYTVTYDFDPDENAWVVDRLASSVKYGKIYQTEIKIHKESDLVTHAKILYYVKFSDSSGTVIADQSDLFTTANDAWAAIGISIGPTPLPPDVTPVPGSTSSTTTVSKINGSSITMYKGQPVYINQIDGRVYLASSDESATTFLGFVFDETIPANGSGRIITEGTINNTTIGWNNIVEGGGGLVDGARYYLATTGKLSSSAPTTGYSRQVGMAASNTELDIRNNPTIKL